jgi:agmatine/peptidylarginine deiminase
MQNTETPRRTVQHPRFVAEWEPTLGVMISYPLNVPHTLVVALAKDHHLYITADSEESKEKAIQDLSSWQVDLTKVSFVVGPHGTDMSWPRDWGPHALFDQNKEMLLVDPLYLHRTPYSSIKGKDPLWKCRLRKLKLKLLGNKPNPDNEMPVLFAKFFNQKIIRLPFALTGGNFYTDGHGLAMSMEVLLNENERLNKVDEDQFFSYCEETLGFKKYAILPNFEDYGIQHIDCFLKMLDEERLLVQRPPQDHKYYDRYNEIIETELKSLRTVYGRRFQILRMDTDRFREDELAAYVNSLILNKHIYVPLYGIPQDQIALQQWQAAMPGYVVQGFEYDLSKETAHIQKYKDIGWRDGDALHCRTRGVWDPNMLYLSVHRLDPQMPAQKEYPVEALVVDYSGQGIAEKSVKVFWCIDQDTDWQSSQMKLLKDTDTYQGVILANKDAKMIKYYIQAQSHSGKEERMPRTAPEGYYQFEIK